MLILCVESRSPIGRGQPALLIAARSQPGVRIRYATLPRLVGKIIVCVLYRYTVGGPFKGPREKGNRHTRDLKNRGAVFALFMGPGFLKREKRSIRDLRPLKKGRYTVSRFTNAIKDC